MVKYILATPEFQSIIEGGKAGEQQLVTGLADSAISLSVEAVLQEIQAPLLLIAPNTLTAKQLFEDLTEMLADDLLHYYPADEVVQMEMAVTSPDIMAQRIETLAFLRSGQAGIAVTSLAGVKRLLPPAETFDKQSVEIKVGGELDASSLKQQLIDMGYVHESLVAAPGEFSVRGGIIDVFPITEENPIRIELFDIEVDSMRYFEVESQRSIKNIEQFTLLPARDQFFLADWLKAANEKLMPAFDKQLSHLKQKKQASSYDALEMTMSRLHDALTAGEPFENLGLFADAIYPKRQSLLDYLADDGLVIVSDYSRLLENEKLMDSDTTQWKLDKAEEGQMLTDLAFTQPVREVMQASSNGKIYFSLFEKGLSDLRLDRLTEIAYRSMQQFYGKMSALQEEIARYQTLGYAVVLMAEDSNRVNKIQENLSDFAIKPTIVSETDSLQAGEVYLMQASYHKGFELPTAKLTVITEKELFNRLPKRHKRRPQKLSNAERIKSYNDLKPGDYVVHENHGVGRYLGLTTMDIGGKHQDYLEIAYRNDGKLYVPADQMQMVQKYVGSEGKAPRLHTLGGTEWAKTKNRVNKQVEDIADELIDLYASRESKEGHAFPADNSYQREFEEAFPYTETADQLRTIKEVKADMESSKPMDRLLVGDVGYGKTEVAIRAIFKAVQDNKQVAFLVPTTVLAQQHYNTLLERFAGFPVNIEMLSRFRSKNQQKETIAHLKAGKVDVVVGTHRLLSNDVKYKDLGLLVVDEEQRFGVKHKEKMKVIKEDVDVLTLTATPIPRTLHMSMVGARDLSVIETPPRNRYPVQTYVMEQNDGAVREAIEREMARGGQVFYLHNRVSSMQEKVADIQELVPDARIAYANGQMSESSLEDVFIDFIAGAYDVLVTTTIIETGVDMPNANTLIVENADHMGLSQLYQLRGRVGRSNRVAYAYLMYQSNKVLKEESVKRLRALKEFTELGSGFKLAMQDLAIRGAGNLLGQQQSGFIDSVGYNLYTEMLKEAVQKRQSKAENVHTDAVLNLDVEAYLPEQYIEDESQRIEIYQRIRSLDGADEYYAIQDDLIDRFGDFPQEVANLLIMAYIKYYADQALIEKITRRKVRRQQSIEIVLSKSASRNIPGQEIFKALADIPEKVDIKMRQQQMHVTILLADKVKQAVWLDYLLTFTKYLAGYVNKQNEEES